MDLDERLQAAFRKLITALGKRVDYHVAYPCTVLKDHGDHTLDLQPESRRLSVMEKIPLDHGLPGLSVKLKKGATVLLVFSNGDPRRPRARLFEAGSLEKLEFVTGLGQRILLEDDRGQTSDDAVYAAPLVRLQNGAGHVTLHHLTQKIQVVATGEVDVQSATLAKVQAPMVILGDGLEPTPLMRVNPLGGSPIPCTNVVGT